MISFTCPNCEHKFAVKDEYAGKNAKCSCGRVIVVPGASDSQTQPDNVDAKPYIRELDVADYLRVYCERCRRAHQGFRCPSCGNDRHDGAFTGCMFCKTTYTAKRKRCPVCNVDENMKKAHLHDDPVEGLVYWHAGYAEAKTNGYRFTTEEHLTHARLLVEAGRGDEAWGLLNRLVVCSGGDIASRSRLHEAMAFHLQVEAQRLDKDNLRADSVFHQLLSDLLSRVQLNENRQKMPEIYGRIGNGDEKEEKYHINRMKRLLRTVGRNKKGKAEQLYAVLKVHWQKLPTIEEGALLADVTGIVQDGSA